MREPWRTLLLMIVIVLSMFFIKECNPDAVAAERSLTLGVWTQHYTGDHTEGFKNRLAGLEVDGWTGAWFKNSYGNETGFGGYTFHTDKHELVDRWWIQGNLAAGVLIGYGSKHPIRFKAASPGVYPTVNIGQGKHSVGLGVMPTFWWLSYKLEFK